MTIVQAVLLLAAIAATGFATVLLWCAAVMIIGLRRRLRAGWTNAAEVEELRDDLRELEAENSILRASLENAERAGRIRARGGVVARIPLH